MHGSRRFARLMASAALVVTLALCVAPVALGDDWARDRAAAQTVAQLDPAIRTALVAHSAEPVAPIPVTSAPTADDEFAWGAAAIGVAVGMAGMCLVLGCVTLVRHHASLRSA
jgi:hypothetical protein